MKFCAIIPDRNDRPELTANCLRMLDRMTLKPDKVYHVNFAPFNDEVDLIPRIKSGIGQAIEDGIDICFIIENDDYYPADYFENFEQGFKHFHFFGQRFTHYYNIVTQRWTLFSGNDHLYRSSLFTTGFKISELNNFDWPDEHNPFLDIPLWKYARHKKRLFIETGAIGIKHGIGKCGGKGHVFKLANEDPGYEWLRSHLDEESFQFYRSVAEKLIPARV